MPATSRAPSTSRSSSFRPRPRTSITSGPSSSAAAAAAEDDGPLVIEVLGLGRKELERDVLGALDVAGIPLVVLANVDQLSALGDELAGSVRRDLGRRV